MTELKPPKPGMVGVADICFENCTDPGMQILQTWEGTDPIIALHANSLAACLRRRGSSLVSDVKRKAVEVSVETVAWMRRVPKGNSALPYEGEKVVVAVYKVVADKHWY